MLKTKYILAVSGGIDSVVLLDILSRREDCELIVAHFDHGIREDSYLDAEFVEVLAKKYGLKFELKREELGPRASEELARNRRYGFLRKLAVQYDAKIVTAHHIDDVVETVAINLLRGTGWRGLAVLDSDITRPLTNKTKSDLIKYAKENGLSWRDDPTNLGDKYLRNQVRKKLSKLDDDSKLQLLSLWEEQKALKNKINDEVVSLVGFGPSYSRYFFTHIDDKVAVELLRHIVNAALTRPQIIKLLHDIKTIAPGKIYSAGGVKVVFTSRNFIVELIK